MNPGLQTHIEFPVHVDRLAQVYSLGVRLARIAAMECPVEAMLQHVADAEGVGLTPVVTIADPERIRLFQPGDYVECRNEDDGDLPPAEYRRILDEMAAIALECSVKLWGGVGSNTDQDTLQWGRDVRGDGWPAGMFGLSWHSYGPYPHKGYWLKSLGAPHPCYPEFTELKALAAGLPIFLSEFGWPNTPGYGEEDQAREIAILWQQWIDLDLWGASLFQIHDGPNPNNREHRYGIYRCDAQAQIGELKPVAYTFPQETPDMSAAGMTPLFKFDHRAVIHNDDGTKSLRWNKATGEVDHTSNRVFSLQPDGSYDDRPLEKPSPDYEGPWGIGGWEKGRPEDHFLVFRVEDARAVFPWQD